MANEPEKPRYTRPRAHPPSAWPLTLGCMGIVLLSLGLLGTCVGFLRGDDIQFHLDYTYGASRAYAQLRYPRQVGVEGLWVLFLPGSALVALAWLTWRRTFSLRRLLLAVLVTGGVGCIPFFLEDRRPKYGIILVGFEVELNPGEIAGLRRQFDLREALPEFRDALDGSRCDLEVDQMRGVVCTVQFPDGTTVATCRRVGDALEKHIEAVAGEFAAKHGLPPLKDENRKRSTKRWER